MRPPPLRRWSPCWACFEPSTGALIFGLTIEMAPLCLASNSIEYHRPLYVGEEVEISAVISDVYEKTGRQTFDVVQLAFTIKGDWDGDSIMTGKQSYILFK